MYRIERCYRRNGRPYIRVELPIMSDPLMDILESVVSAIVRTVEPEAGPIHYWVPRQSSSPSTAEPELDNESESPGAATPGLEKPTHLSTVKGEGDEHGY
jgi:hypothetical protein